MVEQRFPIHTTGNNPIAQPEFSRIKTQINYLNRPGKSVDWALIAYEAQQLFTRYGIDLQTAAYYTLARTHQQGLAGFTEGIELLAYLLNHHWDNIWPTQLTARLNTLNWLNGRVSPRLRKATYTTGDLRLLYRAERALNLIQTTLIQQGHPHTDLTNCLSFIQSRCQQLEPNEPTRQPEPVEPLNVAIIPTPFAEPNNTTKEPHYPEYSTLSDEPASLQTESIQPNRDNSTTTSPPDKDTPLPNTPMTYSTQEGTSSQHRSNIPLWSVFLLGCLASSAIWFITPLLNVTSNPQQEIKALTQRLQRYQESQSAIQADLTQLQMQLLEAEKSKKGLTISYLKTVAYEMERKLVIERKE